MSIKNSKLKITNLQTDYTKNPIGNDNPFPLFSWQMQSTLRAQYQTAYRIVVIDEADKTVWDSDIVNSGKSVGIKYSGEPLLPTSRYRWTVEVWDKNNEKISSEETAYFETGLMSSGWDNAEFIGATIDGDPEESEQLAAPLLRKTFNIGKEIKSARIYATSAGCYKLFLNNEAVSSDLFTPGRTEYPDNTLYQTYDVTKMLKSGKNAIGAILTHGWYNRARGEYGKNLALYMKLVIKYTDGSSDVVASDKDWSYTRSGPVIDDDIYNGEIYDANREIDNWCGADFVENEAWKPVIIHTKEALSIGKISGDITPAVRIVSELKPISVNEPQPKVFVYDFGQNFAGVVKFTAKAPKGTVIQLRHAEAINTKDGFEKGGDGPEGTLYTANLMSANKQMIALSRDRYTFKGAPEGETYYPQYVFHGFRYLEITGLNNPIPLSDITGLVMTSDLGDTSSFECSDEFINSLYSNTLWSKHSNFFSVPQDCPQRCERMGWTGDAQIFCRTSTYLTNCDRFFRKYLMDIYSMQQDNGVILDAVPIGWGDRDKAANGWGDSGVIIPWQIYQQYGDAQLIEQCFDNMCRYADHLIETSDDYIRNIGPYGDWMPASEKTPIEVTDTAYSAYVCLLLSKMAEIIGQKEKAKRYEKEYNNYKTAWRQRFILPDGSLAYPTQTSYVLGLEFGLFNENEIEDAANQLTENIIDNDIHLKGGFLGVCFLNTALSNAGKNDIAYKLLKQDSYPSWIYPITQGATTIWEAFYVYTQWNGFARLSFNHYAYGAIVEWIYRYMLGIERDESTPENVAYKHFKLNPIIGGELFFASGSYDSVYGIIASKWKVENGKTIYSFTVPANTSATLILPITEGQTVTESGSSIEAAVGVSVTKKASDSFTLEIQSGEYEFCVF